MGGSGFVIGDAFEVEGDVEIGNWNGADELVVGRF